jgi:hypothetical protein
MTTKMECPYCIVAGFNFRVMTKNTNDEYVCTNCGHVEYPKRSGLNCSCVRCHTEQANIRPGKLPMVPAIWP